MIEALRSDRQRIKVVRPITSLWWHENKALIHTSTRLSIATLHTFKVTIQSSTLDRHSPHAHPSVASTHEALAFRCECDCIYLVPDVNLDGRGVFLSDGQHPHSFTWGTHPSASSITLTYGHASNFKSQSKSASTKDKGDNLDKALAELSIKCVASILVLQLSHS